MSKSVRPGLIFFTVILLFFIFGCQSSAVRDTRVYDFSELRLEWKNVKDGISYCKYSEPGLIIHCAKIDLTDKNLSIKMLPESAGKTAFTFAEDFAKKTGASVAFNTTPFYLKKAPQGEEFKPAGLCIREGILVSKPLKSYCALAFFKDSRRAEISDSQKSPGLRGAEFAAGGFWQILKDGEIIQFKKIRDSRTAAGLDKDGRTLFVIAVEGEHPSQSTGLTYMECAEFFIALGAVNAMEFDGGGSTQMCVSGNSVLTYKNFVKVPGLIGF